MLIIAALAATMGHALTAPINGRKLVFESNFARSQTLDPQQWFFNNGPVYNHEQEKYTSDNTSLNADGLTIEARKTGDKVTSARLESKQSWKYVYVECTAKVPTGRGTWPAIWMLNHRLKHNGQPDFVGWPDCGEIDIMENVGFDPTNFHFTLHSGKYSSVHNNPRTEITPSTDPEAFHKFGMDWRPDRITFYMDDKAVYKVEKTEDDFGAWPFRDPFYIILNLAIGGDWGGAKGVDEGIFPSKFVIRDLKVYQ